MCQWGRFGSDGRDENRGWGVVFDEMGPSRIFSRLTYANVVATVALFVALGGSSYAALELPANSVGQRQIAFPIGAASGSGSNTTLPVQVCPQDMSCPEPLPKAVASSTIVLKRASELLVMGSASFAEVAPSTTTETVTIDLGPDIDRSISLQQSEIGNGVTAPLSFSEVVPAPAGKQTISLDADAQSTGGPVSKIDVYNPTITLIALPKLQ